MARAEIQGSDGNAWAKAQKSRGGYTKRLDRAPDTTVRVFPNVITLQREGWRDMRFTSEQWAEVVAFVGITGFAPEPAAYPREETTG